MYSSITLYKPVKSVYDEILKIAVMFFLMVVVILPTNIISPDSYAKQMYGKDLLDVSHLLPKFRLYRPPVANLVMLHFKKVAMLNRVTAYNAVQWQTSSHPDIAACGPNIPNQVALSQNLFFKPNGQKRCGQHIMIRLTNGQTIHGVVWDTMNPEWHNAADVLMSGVNRAMHFGVNQGELVLIDYTTKHVRLNSL